MPAATYGLACIVLTAAGVDPLRKDECDPGYDS